LIFPLKKFRVKEPSVLGFSKFSQSKNLWLKVFENCQRASGGFMRESTIKKNKKNGLG
jgi:hypothetical protein